MAATRSYAMPEEARKSEYVFDLRGLLKMDPVEGLRSLQVVRSQIDGVTRDIELKLIGDAVDQGMTYAAIGRALGGLSRQAVLQRYNYWLKRRPPDSGGG